MNDQELADEIIKRLNELIQDSNVCYDVCQLINQRIETSQATDCHPTIQIDFNNDKSTLGFLGLLNGIVGTISEGNQSGKGFITAIFENSPERKLIGFRRTDQTTQLIHNIKGRKND